MKVHVTNPTGNRDYGIWDFKELVMALVNPVDSKEFLRVMPMSYDLTGDELEFEIIVDQAAVIKKAKAMLKKANSGTNECKIYEDGFLDGVQFKTKLK